MFISCLRASWSAICCARCSRTIFAWPLSWMNMAAWRGWSPSKTWWKRSSERFATSTRKLEVVRENETSYIVPGNMDVDRLGELLGIRPEGKESATVAGLVSELAGRIPHRGEVIEEDGLRFEVLESTDRRVERVRDFRRQIDADEADIVRSSVAPPCGGYPVEISPAVGGKMPQGRGETLLLRNSYGLSLRIRLHSGSSQCRQIHAAQCPGRRKAGHHQSPSPRPPATAFWESSTCPNRRGKLGGAGRSHRHSRQFTAPTVRSAAR